MDAGACRFDLCVADVYTSAGTAAEMRLTVPADFATRFGVLWSMLLARVDSVVRLNDMGGAPVSSTTLTLTLVLPVTDSVGLQM